MPEISALLGRWYSPNRLNMMERRWLVDRGFGPGAHPDSEAAAKISAKAKAELLLCELQYRRIEAEAEPSERTAMHLALLRAGHSDGAAAFAVGGKKWAAWRKAHATEMHEVVGVADKSIVSNKVVRGSRNQRYALGEERHNRERYQALLRELGQPFLAGLVDRAAKVRQWELRRKMRAERTARARQRSEGPALTPPRPATKLRAAGAAALVTRSPPPREPRALRCPGPPSAASAPAANTASSIVA